MGRTNKGFSLVLVFTMAISSLLIDQSVFAQSTSEPSVQEFTLKYVDNSIYVQPKNTSSIDPYTGKNTATKIPGYYVHNKAVEATIKNPPSVAYYNFRYKGHYGNEWSYEPFNPNASLPYFLSDSYGVPFQASNSDYTLLSLYFLPPSITSGGQIDIQVQALYGNFDAVPYGHLVPLPPTYDFYFKGEASGWSNTQTITIGETSASTSPNSTSSPSNIVESPSLAVPEFRIITIPLLLSLLTVLAVLSEGNKRLENR